MDKFIKHSMSKELDYSLDDIERRKNKVTQVLQKYNEKLENHYDEYFSVAINKSGFTSENDPVSKELEKMADYLLYMDNKQERDIQDNVNAVMSNRDNEKNNKKEFLTDDLKIVESQIEKNSSNRKKYEKIKVTKKDREEYEPLRQTGLMIEHLKKMIQTGKNSKDEKLSTEQLKKIKWFLIDLRKDEVAIKEKLKGYITFKNITRSNPVYDLEGFSFSNEQHIKTIFDNYSILKEASFEDTNSDIKLLLIVFEELVDQTIFPPYVKDILVLKIDGLPQKDICEMILQEYGNKITEQWLSQITNITIPRLITKTYNESFNDWYYTFVEKGTYKWCTKCKTNKLANRANFNKDSKGKFGLKSICKECHSTKTLNFCPSNDSI